MRAGVRCVRSEFFQSYVHMGTEAVPMWYRTPVYDHAPHNCPAHFDFYILYRYKRRHYVRLSVCVCARVNG